jgi:hypothetical protein
MASTQLSRADHVRENLPEAVKTLTQIVVDNPGQFVLLGSGALVFGRALANLVKPRTPLEALALFVFAEAAGAYLAKQAVDRGILRFKVRDANGCLVPLEWGKQ